MPDPTVASRIRGCILGAALGDALGAPFEFQPVEAVVERTGSEWIDALHAFEGSPGAHGVWRSPAPPGTATDDTRYNWVVLELAAELGRPPDAEDLARRCIDVWERPEAYFPTGPEFARDHFAMWEAVGRGVLGEESAQYPGVPPDVLRERSIGLNFPTLIALIALTTYGTLFPGRADEAYRAAFRADFMDVGCAREAVAVLAGAVAALVAGGRGAEEVVREAAEADPYSLGGPFGGPFMKEHLPPLLDKLPSPTSDQQLAEHLSRELSSLHPFDPLKTLAPAFAGVMLSPDDPLRAILIAVNHRAVTVDGSLGALQDIDCYGCVAGALAGAAAGVEAFPEEMLGQVVAANKGVYGIRLDGTADRIVATFA